MVALTAHQKKASYPGHSAWVAANAGTGKTKVLVDRVLRLMLDGVNPSRILCITYTKAAAAEMANRVYAVFGEWAVHSDDDLRTHIEEISDDVTNEKLLLARQLFARVLDTPDGLKIMTIHSLCQSILRRFPLEAGVHPQFTVIEERTANELLETARARLLTSEHRDAPWLGHALEVLLGRVSDQEFDSLLSEIISKRRYFAPLFERSHGVIRLNTANWESQGLTYQQTEQEIVTECCSYSTEELSELKRIVEILSNGKKSDVERANRMRDWLHSDFSCSDFLSYRYAFLKKTDDLPVAKLFTKDLFTEESQETRLLECEQQRVLHCLQQLKGHDNAYYSEQVIAVAESLLALYERLKVQHAYMDFDDLLLRVAELLHRPGVAEWVLYKLDGGIDHLLIDEAQDTSDEQWRIIDKLSDDFFAGVGARESAHRTLFVVGDEKQSIYRFQGAAPQRFGLEKQRLLGLAAKANHVFESVPLQRSFRSTAPILKVVDAVFAQDSAKQGLSYDGQEVLHEVQRADAPGKVELWPLMRLDAKKDLQWELPKESRVPEEASRLLAHQIAKTIRGWLDEGRILPAKGRPIRPEDILILVGTRKRGSLMTRIAKALKSQSVPVAGLDRLVITEHIAIADLMALGHFLLLPEDDLNLAGLLKSPMFVMSEEDLFTLAYDRGNASLWQRLREAKHLQPVVERLSGWLALTDYITPYQLFSQVLDVDGMRARMIARLGAEADELMDEFLSMALAYGKQHPPSLQGFLHWMEVGGSEVRRDLDAARSEVRIMTVHGAKGLQAPVVFLPDTTGVPDASRKRLFFGEMQGDDPVMLYGLGGRKANGPMLEKLRAAYDAEESAEHRRLLYVAMTRAEDELYVCGYEGERAVSERAWYSLIQSAFVPMANEVSMDWIAGEQLQAHVYETDGVGDVAVESEGVTDMPALPAFALSVAPDERTPPRPLVPSRLRSQEPAGPSPVVDSGLMRRGTLIHRLLQYLPEVSYEKREEKADYYLNKVAVDLDVTLREQMKQEVMEILQDDRFAHVFAPGSMAEVPLSGMIERDGSPFVVSGQIDRLVVGDDSVLIVDYKTSREVPERQDDVPLYYLEQMEIYCQLMERIYPGKQVEGALLWTVGPSMMLLERQAARSAA